MSTSQFSAKYEFRNPNQAKPEPTIEAPGNPKSETRNSKQIRIGKADKAENKTPCASGCNMTRQQELKRFCVRFRKDEREDTRNKTPCTPHRLFAWACLGLISFAFTGAADDLDDAFSQLTAGRTYLKDFPNQKPRNRLVDDFVGANGESPNRPMLVEAIQRAIAIREGEQPDPETFPPARPALGQAKVIAWESLEALLTGYLYAGNRDLLNATRISYPGSGSAIDTRELPAEEATPFAGTAQKQITYARLYFLQGSKTCSNTSRKIRRVLCARQFHLSTVPHYVTFDEEQSRFCLSRGSMIPISAVQPFKIASPANRGLSLWQCDGAPQPISRFVRRPALALRVCRPWRRRETTGAGKTGDASASHGRAQGEHPCGVSRLAAVGSPAQRRLGRFRQ
jgi:hypothetical protein